MYTALRTWAEENFHPVPDPKTSLKIAEDWGLDTELVRGKWYIVKRELPKNLYLDGNRYRYKMPDGSRPSMGSDKEEAIQAAIELNTKLYGANPLVAKVMGSKSLRHYGDQWLARRKPNVKASTYKQSLSQVRLVCEGLPGPIFSISQSQIADFLDSQTDNQYAKLRKVLIELYRIAVAHGDIAENIPEKTLPAPSFVRQRPRMSEGDFQAIYARAPEWLQIAMDFALLSLQREGDILAKRHDEIVNGQMPVIQQKTGKAIMIDVGPQLMEVVRRSMRTPVLSNYIVHKRNQMHPMETFVKQKHLQKVFLKVAREALGKQDIPTFHEIRSLGITMYRNQGLIAQDLAGHEDEKTTDGYDQEIRFTEARTL